MSVEVKGMEEVLSQLENDLVQKSWFKLKMKH